MVEVDVVVDQDEDTQCNESAVVLLLHPQLLSRAKMYSDVWAGLPVSLSFGTDEALGVENVNRRGYPLDMGDTLTPRSTVCSEDGGGDLRDFSPNLTRDK